MYLKFDSFGKRYASLTAKHYAASSRKEGKHPLFCDVWQSSLGFMGFMECWKPMSFHAQGTRLRTTAIRCFVIDFKHRQPLQSSHLFFILIHISSGANANLGQALNSRIAATHAMRYISLMHVNTALRGKNTYETAASCEGTEFYSLFRFHLWLVYLTGPCTFVFIKHAL